MVDGGVIHIDGDGLLSQVKYRVSSSDRYEEDDALRFVDLDLLNAFKEAFGNEHALVCDFGSHRMLHATVRLIPASGGE